MANPVSELIYVAAPYSSPDTRTTEKRMDTLTRYLAYLSSKGQVAFSPLLMHYCLGGEIEFPGDYGFWRNHCLTLLSKSDILHVLMLEGWKESAGVQDEVEFAERNSILVKYVSYITFNPKRTNQKLKEQWESELKR